MKPTKFLVERLLEPTVRMTLYGVAATTRLIRYNILTGPVRTNPDEWDMILSIPAAGASELVSMNLVINLGTPESPGWYYLPLYEQIIEESERFNRRSKINSDNAKTKWAKRRAAARGESKNAS